jgi:hypothetical protein
MSHVLHAISEAFLSSASRPFASFDRVRAGTLRLLARLVQPRPSSLRVSQQWLDEHDATAQKGG